MRSPNCLRSLRNKRDWYPTERPRFKENQITEVPVDLVTASASGLDPHISVAAAEIQVPRIAKERKQKETAIRAIIKEKTQKDWFSDRTFVNVLELNLALDKL